MVDGTLTTNFTNGYKIFYWAPLFPLDFLFAGNETKVGAISGQTCSIFFRVPPFAFRAFSGHRMEWPPGVWQFSCVCFIARLAGWDRFTY